MDLLNRRVVTKVFAKPILPMWMIFTIKHSFAIMSAAGNAFFMYKMLQFTPMWEWLNIGVSCLAGIYFSYVMIMETADSTLSAIEKGRRPMPQPGTLIIRGMNIIGTAMIFYATLDYAEQQKLAQEKIAQLQEMGLQSAQEASANIRQDMEKFKDRTIITHGYMPSMEKFEHAQMREDSLRQEVIAQMANTTSFDNLALFDHISDKYGFSRLGMVLVLVCMIPIAIDRCVVSSTQYETKVRYFKTMTEENFSGQPVSGSNALVPAVEKTKRNINWEDPTILNILAHRSTGMSMRRIAKQADVNKSHVWVKHVCDAAQEAGYA